MSKLSSSSPSMNLLVELPFELTIFCVFRWLSPNDICTLCLTSRRLKEYCEQPMLWKRFCESFAISLATGCTWKQSLRKAHIAQKNAEKERLAIQSRRKKAYSPHVVTELRWSRTIRVGDYVNFPSQRDHEELVRITHLRTARPGKHGFRKVLITGVSPLTGKKHERLYRDRALSGLVFPIVTTKRLHVIDCYPWLTKGFTVIPRDSSELDISVVTESGEDVVEVPCATSSLLHRLRLKWDDKAKDFSCTVLTAQPGIEDGVVISFREEESASSK